MSHILRLKCFFSVSFFCISLKETYDIEKKLVRYKQPNWMNPYMGPVILIHDFNTGIGYNITTGATCSLFNLTLRNFDATDDGSHHIRMKTSQDFFKSSSGSSTFVYKGAAFVRGIAADVWVGKGIEMRNDVTLQVKTLRRLSGNTVCFLKYYLNLV